MIVTFRSPASGDVIMFGDVAHRLMEIMGKAVSVEGIITVEQLPGAIAALEGAVAAEKARLKGVDEDTLPRVEAAEGGGQRDFVSLAQRATPLLELLSWSLKKQKPVVWG